MYDNYLNSYRRISIVYKLDENKYNLRLMKYIYISSSWLPWLLVINCIRVIPRFEGNRIVITGVAVYLVAPHIGSEWESLSDYGTPGIINKSGNII